MKCNGERKQTPTNAGRYFLMIILLKLLLQLFFLLCRYFTAKVHGGVEGDITGIRKYIYKLVRCESLLPGSRGISFQLLCLLNSFAFYLYGFTNIIIPSKISSNCPEIPEK